MTQQTILELSNPFDVHTPLGHTVAMFLIIGSFTSNPQLICKIYRTVIIKSFDTNDVRVYGSPSYGEPLVPEIPEGWIK